MQKQTKKTEIILMKKSTRSSSSSSFFEQKSLHGGFFFVVLLRCTELIRYAEKKEKTRTQIEKTDIYTSVVDMNRRSTYKRKHTS